MDTAACIPLPRSPRAEGLGLPKQAVRRTPRATVSDPSAAAIPTAGHRAGPGLHLVPVGELRPFSGAWRAQTLCGSRHWGLRDVIDQTVLCIFRQDGRAE